MSSEYMTASEEGAHHHEPRYIELSSEEPSADSSATPSRPTSAGGHPPPKKSRVRFNSTSEVNDSSNKRSKSPLRDGAVSPRTLAAPKQTRVSPAHSRNNSVTNLLRRTPETEKENPFADPVLNLVFKPRPSLAGNFSSGYSGYSQDPKDYEEYNEKAFSALAAQERAQRIASLVGSHSAPASRRTSFEDDPDEPYSPPRPSLHEGYPVRVDDIPLVDMSNREMYDGAGFGSDEDDLGKLKGKAKASSSSEAHKLVRAHTKKHRSNTWKVPAASTSGLASGHVTPTGEGQHMDDYVPRPQQYRGGVLSSLLKLYNAPSGPNSRRGSDGSTGSPSQTGTAGSSGITTPRTKAAKWYNHKNHSQDTLARLIEASAILSAQGGVRTSKKNGPQRPGIGKRTHSGKLIDSAMNKISGGGRPSGPRLEDEIRITVHIAETLSRQRYLLKMCRALMEYGAPTHRLEEYMKMSARILEIDGQFLYIPGCMIISFDDASTHTTEVKLVKEAAGLDLGNLKDIHEIYKEVVHDVIGVEEATQRLDKILTSKPRHSPWLIVLAYGLATASVAPFAFEARWIDLPIAGFLGCLLGILHRIIAPKSELYLNVFEISAAVLTSFLARAFGSINGGNLFCFSALAQSSIALILPGYAVLCASLELQSRSMVAGSVRMVYAIIYSLFLGYGITIGTVLYGLLDSNATSATTCSNPIPGYQKWIFPLLFTLCLCYINQAKWKQVPAMLLISIAGYIVNFFSARKFPSSPQISNTFGALAIGVMGNLYSRVRHGAAAAALIPAIFVQVPSGLAASGSLLAGLSSADLITNTTFYANGTAKFNGTSSVSGGGSGDGNLSSPNVPNTGENINYIIPYVVCLLAFKAFLCRVSVTSGTDLNTIVFNVGYNMIQIAIGITVGLFLSALIVYPLGKRRSGLFSF